MEQYSHPRMSPSTCKGRLTLQGGMVIHAAGMTDVTIYVTPHADGRVALYTGREWVLLTPPSGSAKERG